MSGFVPFEEASFFTEELPTNAIYLETAYFIDDLAGRGPRGEYWCSVDLPASHLPKYGDARGLAHR